ncbi:MAG: Rpn family recombination-promoting nuclease/putative transposase [Clostridia bacterium]|nr:Rpn family recombination-promoting nuclease/putative transposase [Clostridia bacterium]
MIKKFQELDLSNSYLFAAALENPETCKLVLEIILGIKIPNVKVHAEHSILLSSDFRSVRLDLYASDEMQVHYNVEAQNYNHYDLPKRSRYHQAEMDVSSLKPGDDFEDLKPSYMIFICSFDPFEGGRYRYTFEQRCQECDMALGDETKRIFLNTKGKNDSEVPQELIHFLGYMENSTDEYVEAATDESISILHGKVKALKQKRTMEEGYMTFEELLKDREIEGKTQGKIEGKAEGKAEAVIDLLDSLGIVSDELRMKIFAEKDKDVLKQWLQLAAKSVSVEEFRAKM